ncbi:MAG: helix-turn-helix domain-containing protein, partial [Gammaproteobacteria bacterium]|nr:helix-turn-helix domain-containing protein [Gammaproteobacteria bacterium]
MSEEDKQDFGALLKNAREDKNISIAQISEALKLSLEKIESIEKSDSGSLPAAAFTCGYLRLFAKLVGVNEEDVVRQYYFSIGDGVSAGLPNARSDLPAQTTSEHLGMRIVSYSLVLVVAVLFIVWLQGSEQVTINSDDQVNNTETGNEYSESAESEVMVTVAEENSDDALTFTRSETEMNSESLV